MIEIMILIGQLWRKENVLIPYPKRRPCSPILFLMNIPAVTSRVNSNIIGFSRPRNIILECQNLHEVCIV